MFQIIEYSEEQGTIITHLEVNEIFLATMTLEEILCKRKGPTQIIIQRQETPNFSVVL